MKLPPSFSPEHLEPLSHVLGDVLVGSQIGELLAECKVADPLPNNTKWRRIYNALAEHQSAKGSSKHIVAFVHKSMKPVRWTSQKERYERTRSALNEVLAFVGLEIRENGEIHGAVVAKTLSEAEGRADHLRSKLQARDVHPEVLRFCRAELLQQNYFHAVLEAAKSVAEKMRLLSGLKSDGADLVRDAFSIGKSGTPILAINGLDTDTEKGEQRGFVNLLIGLFGVFRNPTAHAPKISWDINEQDALDILSLVSLVHRKLDMARLA